MSETLLNDGTQETPERPALLRRHVLRKFCRGALDIVLPPLCVSCRARISEHHALCPACWQRIDFIRPPLCDRLGIPMPYDTGAPMLSAAGAASSVHFDRARAVAKFDGLMRELIHAFKFHDNHDSRRLFGRWLADAGSDILAGADCLVPVPLGRRRLLSRRFNQSQILSSEVSRVTGKPIKHFALRRKRSTEHQIGLTRDQRRRNVAGAFVVPQKHKSSITGKAIVLIDDVITSGATASAAALALKRAGAASVDVLALGLVAP